MIKKIKKRLENFFGADLGKRKTADIYSVMGIPYEEKGGLVVGYYNFSEYAFPVAMWNPNSFEFRLWRSFKIQG